MPVSIYRWKLVQRVSLALNFYVTCGCGCVCLIIKMNDEIKRIRQRKKKNRYQNTENGRSIECDRTKSIYIYVLWKIVRYFSHLFMEYIFVNCVSFSLLVAIFFSFVILVVIWLWPGAWWNFEHLDIEFSTKCWKHYSELTRMMMMIF